jgi:hypothetical protein
MSRRLLLIALLLAGSAHAAMYKWVDADGTVQYTAQPPPDRPATTIAPPPRVAPPAPAPAGEEKPAGGAPEETAEEAKRRAEILRKNCEVARGNLEVYNTARRVKEGDEYTYLDDAAREKRIAEAKSNIQKFCK